MGLVIGLKLYTVVVAGEVSEELLDQIYSGGRSIALAPLTVVRAHSKGSGHGARWLPDAALIKRPNRFSPDCALAG